MKDPPLKPEACILDQNKEVELCTWVGKVGIVEHFIMLLSYVKYIMCPSQFHLSSAYGRRCWTISSPGRSRVCPSIHEEQRHVCGGLGGSAIRLSTLPETATARRWRSDGGAARVLCNGLYHF